MVRWLVIQKTSHGIKNTVDACEVLLRFIPCASMMNELIQNLSDSSVDCSLVFVASFQARSSVNQSCPLATVMCCARESHSFNPVMSLLDKMDRFSIPFSSGDLPTS